MLCIYIKQLGPYVHVFGDYINSFWSSSLFNAPSVFYLQYIADVYVFKVMLSKPHAQHC